MFRCIMMYLWIMTIFLVYALQASTDVGNIIKEMYEATSDNSDEKSDENKKSESEEKSSEVEKKSESKTNDSKETEKPKVFEIVPTVVESSAKSDDKEDSEKTTTEEKKATDAPSAQADDKKSDNEEKKESKEDSQKSDVVEQSGQSDKSLSLIEASGVGDFDSTELQEPRGNWLIKRIWLQKAERVIGEINDLISQLLDLSMEFNTQRDAFEAEVIEPFYLAIGMDKGVLTDKVESLIEQIENHREDEGDLTESERAFLEKLHAEKDTLKRLSKEVETVAYLEDLLEQALNRLKERLSVARRYQREANEMVQTIAQEKSDGYARVLYEKIVNRVHNIEDINTFFSGEFKASFDSSLHKIRESIDHVKVTVEALKKNNLLLTNELASMEEQDQHAHDQKTVAVDKVPVQQNKSWWSGAWDYVTSFFR